VKTEHCMSACPLRAREQIPGPVEGALERRLARAGVARAPLEHVEAAGEPLLELPRLQHADAGGSELDGERQAVEAAHDVGDDLELALGGREAGARHAGPVEEERHRLRRRRVGRGARHRERLHGERVLGGEAQELPRGDEEAHLGCAREPAPHGLGPERHHLLKVVEDEQQRPAAGEDATHGCDVVVAGHERHAEDAGHGGGDAVDAARVRQVTQIRAAAPLGEAPHAGLGVADGQARLPRPGRAVQGDEAGALIEAALDLLEVRGAPHKARCRGRQVSS
jgi:hypothetical protein